MQFHTFMQSLENVTTKMPLFLSLLNLNGLEDCPLDSGLMAFLKFALHRSSLLNIFLLNYGELTNVKFS
jgi:hypothetical protein